MGGNHRKLFYDQYQEGKYIQLLNTSLSAQNY